MNKKPKLSVLVTAHGFEKYLEQCLDSIVSQKVNFDYEILCNDDCSPDRSPQILEEYQKKYPHLIKIMKNETNLHYPRTNARLISSAAGDYFIHIDGDDYLIDENKLQLQVDFLEKNKDFMGVGHNTMLVYEDKSKKDVPMIDHEINEVHNVYDIVRGRTYFHTSSMMYRNIFGKNIPYFFSHIYAGDWLFMIVYAEHGNIGYINKIMSVYRIHQGGTWTSLGDTKQIEKNIDFCPYYNKFLNYRYNMDFLQRAETFIEYLKRNFPEELNKNFALKQKVARVLKTTNFVKKLARYKIKLKWGTSLIKPEDRLSLN